MLCEDTQGNKFMVTGCNRDWNLEEVIFYVFCFGNNSNAVLSQTEFSSMQKWLAEKMNFYFKFS